MTQKEIKENLSITPWTILDGNEGGIEVISNTGLGVCDITVNFRTQANAAAICHAVNNTYGKGIDPTKVEEMREVLNMILLSIEGGGRTVTFNDLQIAHIQELLNSAKL